VTIAAITPHFATVAPRSARAPSSSDPMRMLVTGASGFAGSLLVPRLHSDGHLVRAFGRDSERVHEALSFGLSVSPYTAAPTNAADIEIMQGDVLTGEGLDAALEGVEVAYYLIHSMERSPSDHIPFAERERIAAETFAAAAIRAGVHRIVYLGGLTPQVGTQADQREPHPTATSRHLASRESVQRILMEAVPDSVALRASIVIGARSRSFRLLVHLVERLPVLTLPAWRRFRTQPIDARDTTAMLAAAALAPVGGRSLDVGGPDALTYEQMLSTIAELMLVNRPALRLGVNLTALAGRVAAAIAGEDPELVLPLMEGLQGDILPADDRAAELLHVKLHAFDSAVEHALWEWEQFEPLAAR
jgi:uncharacterized protein YbjT (DUF2867 family)